MTNLLCESKRIKDRLRDCETVADVGLVADEEREAVRQLARQGDEGKTQAIQIANLKQWKIWDLGKAK